jgi:hypothetical protein
MQNFIFSLASLSNISATVYTQVGKPDPQLTLQPTNQNLTLALPQG